MAVTRLKRKELKNRVRAKKRREKIKALTHLPPIKMVDVEKIKEEFAKKPGKKSDAKKEEASAKAKTDAEKEDTTAIKKEPAKANAGTKKEDTTAVEKEPAKAQVKDTPVTEESKKEKGSSEEKE